MSSRYDLTGAFNFFQFSPELANLTLFSASFLTLPKFNILNRQGKKSRIHKRITALNTLNLKLKKN